MKNAFYTLFLWIYAIPLVLAADYKLADPDARSLFGADTKVVKGFYTIEWVINGAAALFAIMCFVSAGNMARQGNYGRAAGAVIGGVISALGAYLVSATQA